MDGDEHDRADEGSEDATKVPTEAGDQPAAAEGDEQAPDPGDATADADDASDSAAAAADARGDEETGDEETGDEDTADDDEAAALHAKAAENGSAAADASDEDTADTSDEDTADTVDDPATETLNVTDDATPSPSPAEQALQAQAAVEAVLPEIELPPPNSVPVPPPFSPPKVSPAPQVTDVEPDHGSILGDTKVTLRGDNLSRQSIVRFGGNLATPLGAEEPHTLRVLAPPCNRSGRISISVQNPGGEPVEISSGFSYDKLPAPHITSVAPNRGRVAGGTELTINGENFVRNTSVLLNGDEVSGVTFVDSNALDLKTPPGTHGKTLDVQVSNPDGQSDAAPRAFQYDERY